MVIVTKRCTRCVLPDTIPNIEFDEDGVCNHCRTHRSLRYKGEAALERKLDLHRDSGRKYNCIVAVSGGRDSSFALWKMVKEYDMRVLAVNYENPFTSQQARANQRARRPSVLYARRLYHGIREQIRNPRYINATTLPVTVKGYVHYWS